MKTYNYNWVITLTAAHFVSTLVAFEWAAVMGLIKRKGMPFWENALVGTFCTGSVVFMNYSLQLNSVGFYQMTKLLCIPTMVIIQTYLYGEVFSAKVSEPPP